MRPEATRPDLRLSLASSPLIPRALPRRELSLAASPLLTSKLSLSASPLLPIAALPKPSLRCLVSLPWRYKVLVPWPKSRDMVRLILGFGMIMFLAPNSLNIRKTKTEYGGVYLVFLLSGTQFKDGVSKYIEFIEQQLCLSTASVISIDLHNPYAKASNPYANASDPRYDIWNLSGRVDHSLLQLKFLRHLNLSYNNFNDLHIPRFIGFLKRLKTRAPAGTRYPMTSQVFAHALGSSRGPGGWSLISVWLVDDQLEVAELADVTLFQLTLLSHCLPYLTRAGNSPSSQASSPSLVVDDVSVPPAN
ncbi:hypothetical protein ZIOFF_004401 [Zingiber officinale]|uniref:Uncharacterized protein n=1 Tax=Zingiber officinale TaxID=94328 RepID=A0A8J5IAB3_ZINOF|nr:hypothetical protein ZIOFF_004401 [Zingiber officinale]